MWRYQQAAYRLHSAVLLLEEAIALVEGPQEAEVGHYDENIEE